MSEIATSTATRSVVIVGGGLAGMAAAEAISIQAPNRFRITLLEAKKNVGGRAGSFADPTTGETVDYCQHVAMGCCTNLIGMLDRCGLQDQLRRHRELVFLHPRFPASRFAPSRWLPAPLHLAGALSSLRFLSSNQRRQIRRGMWRLFRTPSERLAGQSATDWLSAAGQDRQTIENFWSVILISALGERPEVVSMAVARKVFVDGFAGAVGASDVLVPCRPLAELFGIRLRSVIEDLGVAVHTGQPVKRIDGTNGDVVVETQDGSSFAADHVIVAVPWYATTELLPSILSSHAHRFANFPASPITGVHLWFDRQWTDREHAVMVGTVSQWMFRQPWVDESNPDQGYYYQVVISASQEARKIAKQDLVKKVVMELQQAFPQAGQAKLIRSRIVTDPKSVFSVCPEVESARPTSKTDLPWLHLAGDWIATQWPATMEGAVISGRMAASSVLSAEGYGSVAIDPGLPRGWLARRLIR